MAIHQKQVMTLQQKLSPQQIQMIKLLELPTVQLEQRIKQEIEENIVLEEAEQQNEEEEPQQISVDEYLREDDTPAYKMRANNYSKDDKPRQIPLSGGRSLQEYLIEQLGYRNLSEEEMRLAVYLVGSIDEDGYLRRDLESVADDIAFTLGEEVSPERLEAILKVIHDLEPAGIGARNLRECLLLQLSQLPMTTRSRRLARKILTSYFDEFAKKHYEKLISRLQVTEDEFRDAIAEIRHLSPKPANGYSDGGSDAAPYVVPDFILDYHDGRFELSLNSYNVPDVRINRRYVEMMRDMVSSDGRVQEKNREAVQFVKNKIDSAKWFISAIKQRRDTLMRTMQEILDFQQEYFKTGDQSKLRPMILKDIADRTGLDVSTISRVVNSKYVQTQFGIILLKSLFSEAMQTASGGEVSSYEIKNIHRRRRQAPSADGRNADGYTQRQRLLHRAPHGGQIPRNAGHSGGASAKTDLMDESRIADPSSALRRSDRSLPTRLSRAVSVVLHPLVMPLYVILLLVAGPTQLSYFPASVKFYLLWVTVLYTAVIPLLSVGLLRSVGRISSLAIDDRRERILPLAIGIVCYLLCAATVARIPSAMIVRKFMLAGACCELFCLAVTFYWKISLHLAAQGAAAALLVLLTFGNAGNLTGALAVAVLAAGALASARLWLGCHTIRQVAAGYAGGFIVATLAVLLL